MRSTVAFLLMASFFTSACASGESTSYFLLVKDDGRTWCAYSSKEQFDSDIGDSAPTESARVTYNSDGLEEITYQATPESGDWIVVDKYTMSVDRTVLRRAIILAQRRLQVIQETTISGDAIAPFHIVSTTTLDGKESTASNVELPDVEVKVNLSQFPFMALVKEMRNQSVSKLCRLL